MEVNLTHLAQRLKIRQLKVVLAIAQHRSLSKASYALGISQPALTKALQDAEEVIGARLFDRLPRGVIPTAYGEVVLVRAEAILSELAQLGEELAEIASGAAGMVSIGVLPAASAGLLPGALARLRRSNPGLGVRVVEGLTRELLPMLAAGDIDVVVGRLYAPEAPDEFRREPLYQEPIVVLARSDHPVFDQPALTAADLPRFELALPSSAQRLGRDIEEALMSMAVPLPPAAVRSTSLSLIRELVHDGNVLTILPALMLAGDLLRGTVRVVPIEILTPPRPAGLISLVHRRRTPGTGALVGAVAAQIGHLRAQGILT
ncbi:MAG TPA: LysR substrate-binding domain-containing protein [Azospirillum sp.]|nr:LysR substrate-binding domain-containing protein [Azospirillum sp.]